jgi:hypothetical protein
MKHSAQLGDPSVGSSSSARIGDARRPCERDSDEVQVEPVREHLRGAECVRAALGDEAGDEPPRAVCIAVSSVCGSRRTA